MWAIKFVLHDALGGGGPRSLRSDNLGKTLGAALLRLRVDVPDDIVERSARRGRRAPLTRGVGPAGDRRRYIGLTKGLPSHRGMVGPPDAVPVAVGRLGRSGRASTRR